MRWRNPFPALVVRNWHRLFSIRGNDLKALKDHHGEKFGDFLLNNNLGISPQSFQQSMWSYLEKKKYGDVLEIYDVLSHSHPYKNLDLHIIAMLASCGRQSPKKVRGIAKTLKTQYPALDPRLLPTVLITGYSYSNRLHPTENVIVSWLRLLPGSQFSNLLTDLESERNPSDGFDTEICDFQSQSELSPPGLRVWHSLLYIYSNRGAWKQAIAILNYLKSSSRVDSVVYHRVITSLCHSKDLSSFSIAMNYYKEMKLDEIIPHPLTLVPLLRCLSNWSREGVAYADSLTQLADLSCSTCIQLSKMTDEQFLEYYLSNHTLLDTEEGFNFEALDSSLRDRQYVIEEIFTQLMISLACDRGLTVFAHSLKDHLQSHEVKVSTEGVFALIQGYCMANRWRDGLSLYQELSDKGVPMYGSKAYHWIADAMIRTDSKSDLAKLMA